MEPRSLESPPAEQSQPGEEESNIRDEERAFAPRDRPSSISLRSAYRDSVAAEGEETELQTRPSSIYSSTAYIRRQTARLLEAIKPSAHRGDGPIPPKLQELVNSYKDSDINRTLNAEILEVAAAPAAQGNGTTELPDVATESSITRGRKRATWGTQFRILSGRAFKNLYRDPALLAAHYISSIGIACEYAFAYVGHARADGYILAVICGFFFQNITNDIAGFQNRLGMFFFTLALFGFSCLSSLNLFANERILFMRERCVVSSTSRTF